MTRLCAVVQQALHDTDMGELESLKLLPGMVDAAVDTLHKAWRAGIDLQAAPPSIRRLASIARLERAVLAALPPAMMRPTDLVTAALRRLDHAPALFGPIEIVGLTELSPCWRPLLHALAARLSVRWTAGPRSVPAWLDGEVIDIDRTKPCAPSIDAVSAATAITKRSRPCAGREAARFGSGRAVGHRHRFGHSGRLRRSLPGPARRRQFRPSLRPWREGHGRREGQAAAALADILVRGLSQTRMRRLAALLAAYPGPFQALPEGWMRILPTDAPLASPRAWNRLIDRLGAEDWPDGTDHGPALRDIVSMLAKGCVPPRRLGPPS